MEISYSLLRGGGSRECGGGVNEESVEIEVLHDPGREATSYDIIFIHGIKGALDKTWTQGLWHLDLFTVIRKFNLSVNR